MDTVGGHETQSAYPRGIIPVEPRCLSGFDTFAIVEPVRSLLIDRIRELVQDLTQGTKFPGPNPCSIERSNLRSFKSQKYWVCDKTDGIRCLFVCINYIATVGEDTVPVKLALLVTRNWDVFVLKIDTCPRVWRQGVVCDGELVKIDHQWTWLGFDAVIVSGIPVWKEPLSVRLRCAQLAWKDYVHTSDELLLRWKPFYPSVLEYMEAMKGMKTVSDGVILTPENDPIRVGRHRRLFKLKHNDKHTVDFLVTCGVDLHVYNPGTKQHVKVATLKSSVDGPDGSIAECSFVDNVWSFVCFRTDKSTANDLLTYNKTLVNIEEVMTLHDLV
jgi:hypothetical protein